MKINGKRHWYTVAVALFFALLLTGCGSKNVNAQAGETVETSKFEFVVDQPETYETYRFFKIPQGKKLVGVTLTVENTSDETYTMMASDFQIQWGDGDQDFGTCLDAVDSLMMPYSYELSPGQSRKGNMMIMVPQDCTQLVIAYEDLDEDGKRTAAYFVEVPL